MIVSHNSKYLFLGCVDYFGSFDCEDFIKSSSTGTKWDAKDFVNMNAAGGGFGIMRIIDLAPDIFIIIEKGKRSFVGCLFPLNASVKKVKQASRNFFFKSFESFEAGSNHVTLERRGSRVHLRCAGSLDEKMPIKDVDISGATEVSFDLRQVDKISDWELNTTIATLQETKSIKKIKFDFVPMALVKQITPLVALDPSFFEIGSVWDSIACPSFKAVQNMVLKPLENENVQVKDEAINCPSCGALLK